KGAKPGPADLAALARSQALLLAEGQVIAPQSRASGADLADLAAAWQGIEKPLALLQPLLNDADPAFAAKIDVAMRASLPPADDLPEQRLAFAAALTALAELA